MTYTNSDQQQPAQQQHGSVAGLVVLGVLVLSSRLRNGLGLLAAAAVVLGAAVAVLATVVNKPDIANIGGGIMVAGLAAVVLYLVASFWAWVLGIVVEAVRRDYFDDERNVS